MQEPAVQESVPGFAPKSHRVVIVGGGAGGLELATRLGGRGLEVVLVDASLTHIWKPLLHEVAAGSLDRFSSELDYMAHARRHGFHYHLGEMEALDRQHKTIWLAPLRDAGGALVGPRRSLIYDTLVLAVGARVNDFGTPGVRKHAVRLDTPDDARRLHHRVLAACLRADLFSAGPARIAIVGGGATGVELAAELQSSVAEYQRYADPGHGGLATISIVEAGADILAGLSGRVRDRVRAQLLARGIQILTNTRVESVNAVGVHTAGGGFVDADVVVWAAGMLAPAWLGGLDGLETNKLNQLVVTPALRATRDSNIYAFGDCAACAWAGHDRLVPALAQAAHQQARHLATVLPIHAARGTAWVPPPFAFHERGSLVSLGPHDAVGSLIGRLSGHRFFVDGLIASLTYRAVYRSYLAALYGWPRMVLTLLGGWLSRSAQYRIKLH